MNGRDSYGVPAGFAGISRFLPQPPYFSGGLRRGFTFGYPPVGLLNSKDVYHAEQKGNRLPPAYPRPERRGLRSPWGQGSGTTPAVKNGCCWRR